MQAAEELEKQIQALQARRAAIVRGDIPPADAEALEALRSPDSKLVASRPKKRKRDVSSSEFEVTSSSDESDLTSSESESSSSDSSSSSGSSCDRRRRKKKSKKKKGKLRVKDVLANWRRQARRMPVHGKDQMVQLLRLLKKQRRTISKKALASYVEELH